MDAPLSPGCQALKPAGTDKVFQMDYYHGDGCDDCDDAIIIRTSHFLSATLPLLLLIYLYFCTTLLSSHPAALSFDRRSISEGTAKTMNGAGSRRSMATGASPNRSERPPARSSRSRTRVTTIACTRPACGVWGNTLLSGNNVPAAKTSHSGVEEAAGRSEQWFWATPEFDSRINQVRTMQVGRVDCLVEISGHDDAR